MIFFAECPKSNISDLATRMQRCGATSLETLAAEDSDKGLIIGQSDSEIEHPWIVPIKPLFSRGEIGPNGGNYFFKVGMCVPAAARVEFLDWYRNEHLPILLECPTWNGCRFFEKPASQSHQFYALHQLADRSALESEERQRSRATPWFMRLKQHAWFDQKFMRERYLRCDFEGASCVF